MEQQFNASHKQIQNDELRKQIELELQENAVSAIKAPSLKLKTPTSEDGTLFYNDLGDKQSVE